MGVAIEVQILETLQNIEQHLLFLVERKKFKDKVYTENQQKAVRPKDKFSPLEQGPELMMSKPKTRLTCKDILLIILSIILVSAVNYLGIREIVLRCF